MAPAISRSVTAASSVASSLPHSSSFSLKNNNKAFNLRNAFLPQIGTRSNSFSCSVLKWKLERRESRVVVRCEAATVAEKETPESSGEKYEYQAEGEVEFRSVLYIPGMAPLNNEDVVNPKTKNIHLYVKRVFISDDFDGELFPRYLSFVKGVVDSNDLPFNVSREILQESRIVRIMRKRLLGKAFDMIQDLAESENKEKRSEQMKAIWASRNKRPHNGGARPFAARVEEYKKKGEQAPHAKTYIDMYKKFDLKGMSWVQQASDEVVASLMMSMPPIEDTSDGSSSASVIAPLRLPVDVDIRVMEKVVGPSRGTRVLGLGSGFAKQPKRRGSSQAEPKNAAVEEKLTRLRAYQKELEVRFQQKERDRERERQDREKDSEREQQERKRDRERERQDREKDREREQEERERDRERERQDREKDREREQEQRERDRERERQDREKDRERE